MSNHQSAAPHPRASSTPAAAKGEANHASSKPKGPKAETNGRESETLKGKPPTPPAAAKPKAARLPEVGDRVVDRDRARDEDGVVTRLYRGSSHPSEPKEQRYEVKVDRPRGRPATLNMNERELEERYDLTKTAKA